MDLGQVGYYRDTDGYKNSTLNHHIKAEFSKYSFGSCQGKTEVEMKARKKVRTKTRIIAYETKKQQVFLNSFFPFFAFIYV